MDLATAQTRLVEVESRIHALAMGTATVEIQKDGRRQRFTMADMPALEKYKRDLQTEIERLTAVAAGAASPGRRMIPVYFTH